MDLGDLVEVKVGLDVGGCRGVFAKRNIKPGEVVFRDFPLLTVKAKVGEPLVMNLARRILKNPKRDEILQHMSVLYPQKLSELTPEMLERAKGKHGNSVSLLSGKQIEPKINDEDILCLLLKICFSAFCGGIYLKKGMLNHCCRPNAVGFQPGQRMNSNGTIINSDASEVV
eukprot:CAMPEP_0113702538 /NCGR_PEP_ID=MMETSP0038_2-20120614/25263_1 /TAXON_ID=2898 /ORGANISM="Cryptomonas paramecium" /LENGTH=170 /DNA_ID=CAMNT_0000626707 /DNA_START=34 /DNA_END=542 /DNA_ORIENTATION=+ /assembly_acc=CAM_ASM_000170